MLDASPEFLQHVREQTRKERRYRALLCLPLLLPFLTTLSYRIFVGAEHVALIEAIYAPFWLFVVVCLYTKLSIFFAPFAPRPPLAIHDPKVYRMAVFLAKKAGLKRRPRIDIVDHVFPNAGAMQNLRGSYVLIFTTGLLKTLNDRELAAVIAHELSHIKRKFVYSRILELGLGSLLFVQMIWTMFIFSSKTFASPASKEEVFALGWAIGCLLIVQSIHTATAFAIRRADEFLADAGALTITDWSYRIDLARGLRKIDDDVVEILISKSRSRMMQSIPEFLRTHPTTEKRIRALGLSMTDAESDPPAAP